MTHMHSPTPAEAGTLDYIIDDNLLERAYMLMCENGPRIPDAVRHGEWAALRTHLLERLSSGPHYRLSRAQMKALTLTLKGPNPK